MIAKANDTERPEPANDAGAATLTLADIYMLVGAGHEPINRPPNPTDFAIEALDDASRTLRLLVEAIHDDPDDVSVIEDVATNAYYRARAARDIVWKLTRGGQ